MESRISGVGPKDKASTNLEGAQSAQTTPFPVFLEEEDMRFERKAVRALCRARDGRSPLSKDELGTVVNWLAYRRGISTEEVQGLVTEAMEKKKPKMAVSSVEVEEAEVRGLFGEAKQGFVGANGKRDLDDGISEPFGVGSVAEEGFVQVDDGNQGSVSKTKVKGYPAIVTEVIQEGHSDSSKEETRKVLLLLQVPGEASEVITPGSDVCVEDVGPSEVSEQVMKTEDYGKKDLVSPIDDVQGQIDELMPKGMSGGSLGTTEGMPSDHQRLDEIPDPFLAADIVSSVPKFKRAGSGSQDQGIERDPKTWASVVASHGMSSPITGGLRLNHRSFSGSNLEYFAPNIDVVLFLWWASGNLLGLDWVLRFHGGPSLYRAELLDFRMVPRFEYVG
ncbi:hypothetical protein U1Q18_032687 [Sarracenia purpurea var. burkii]